MENFYFPIKNLMQEASERSSYRGKKWSMAEGSPPVEMLVTGENDYPILTDYLKEAADHVYIRLQTLFRRKDDQVSTYTFVPGDKIVFDLNPYKDFDKSILTVLYTTAKDYMVEGMLKGFYMEIAFEPGLMVSTNRQHELNDKMLRLRLQTKGKIKTRYTTL